MLLQEVHRSLCVAFLHVVQLTIVIRLLPFCSLKKVLHLQLTWQKIVNGCLTLRQSQPTLRFGGNFIKWLTSRFFYFETFFALLKFTDRLTLRGKYQLRHLTLSFRVFNKQLTVRSRYLVTYFVLLKTTERLTLWKMSNRAAYFAPIAAYFALLTIA